MQNIKFSPGPDPQELLIKNVIRYSSILLVLAIYALWPSEIGQILLNILLEISNLQPFILDLYLLYLYQYSRKIKCQGLRSSTEKYSPQICY